MSDSKFSNQERKQYLLKKYIKEHLFDFILTIILNIIFVIIVVYITKGVDYMIGIALAFFYSLGKIIYDIQIYKKEYLDVDFCDK